MYLIIFFSHKNAYFLVKSEGICTINHVISYKRGGFWKPPCVIFLVSILKNAYLVRKLTTKKEQRMSCSFYMQRNNNYLDSFENIKETTARPPQIKHQADQNTRSA